MLCHVGHLCPPGGPLCPDSGSECWPPSPLTPYLPPTRFSAHPGDTGQAAAEAPAEASSPSSSAEDFCYVFMVELERGPSGLGMGLIDGMVRSPGPQPSPPVLVDNPLQSDHSQGQREMPVLFHGPAFGSTDGVQCFAVGHTGTMICDLAISRHVHREGCVVQGLCLGEHVSAPEAS